MDASFLQPNPCIQVILYHFVIRFGVAWIWLFLLSNNDRVYTYLVSYGCAVRFEGFFRWSLSVWTGVCVSSVQFSIQIRDYYKVFRLCLYALNECLLLGGWILQAGPWHEYIFNMLNLFILFTILSWIDVWMLVYCFTLRFMDVFNFLSLFEQLYFSTFTYRIPLRLLISSGFLHHGVERNWT